MIILTFLVGVALPTALVWNPGHWEWAEKTAALLHDHSDGVEGEEGVQWWTCGMHPDVLQDEPGTCPICNMNLTPVKVTSEPIAAETSKERKIKYWVAPMEPTYISDEPGKSPMGMDLVPVYEEEEPEAVGVHVDPSFIQNFAVRTTVVEKGSIPIEIRTLGILSYNEKNITSINTKFEGWIEKANVNYVGESVKRGDALFEIYSPPLVTTQQEYLATVAYLNKLSDGASEDAVKRAQSLLSATVERLRYWDIDDAQIDQLKESGKVTRTLKIASPVSGVVIEKMGDSLEGMKLSPAMNVYKIADFSTVWADIEVYENQIQYLKLGLTADITVDAFPGRSWSGKIIYIDPSVNRKTRTLKAYVEIANPDRKLRPDMYTNVQIRVPALTSVVKVPEEAILHSGERSVVVVEKEKGYFEPREVELGASGDGYTSVLRGLEQGETIVTSSQFLIDSESNLNEAIQKLLAAKKAEAEQREETVQDNTHEQ